MGGLIHQFRARLLVQAVRLASLAALAALASLASALYALPGQAEEPSKRILLIHSYDSGFAWTDDQSDGFLESLRNSGIPFTASIEYMDWKHYPTGTNLLRFEENMRYKYADTNFDLVLTTDDAALEFAMDHRQDLLHGAPLVFSGVNGASLPSLLKDTRNVAGIVEEVDPVGTLQAALHINPSLTDVHLLFDNSESGASTGKLVLEELGARFPGIRIHALNHLSYSQVMEHVRTLGQHDIVLMTTYFSDGLGQVLDFSEAARAIGAGSSVPVYHLYDFSLHNGAFGGSMISGKLQGSEAADLGLELLRGRQPGLTASPPGHTIRKVFDYEQLQRFRIPLSRIPPGSEIINKPVTFYETYRSLVWGTAAVFTGLLAFIGVLIYYITRIRRMRKSLSRSEERFRLATNGSLAVIWDLDLETGRYFFSDSWYQYLGFARGETGEEHGGWSGLLHPEDRVHAEQEHARHLMGMTPFFHVEFRLRCKDGSYRWFDARGKALPGPEGRYIRLAGSLIDISDRKEVEFKLYSSYQELETTYEELTATQEELQENYDTVVRSQSELHRLAYYDALSGMPNRVSLLAELDRYMEQEPEEPALIFFLDIDNFKYINDTLGLTAGDQLIRQAAGRLMDWTSGRASVYRLSGDEFILFIKDRGTAAAGYSRDLLEQFREPVRVKDIELYISVSIGIACYPVHGRTAEELLKNADMAMHKAKETGKGKAVEYTSALIDTFNSRMVIETHLRGALKHGEFTVCYQPKVSLRTGAVTGFEALIRWFSPVLGPVSPLSFIQVAEDCRLIGPIGDWVLRESCAFIRGLHRQGFPGCTVSVNISVVQLVHEEFVGTVLSVLESTGLTPDYLELEITESIFMESYEKAIHNLQLLKSHGIRIALDDFGTGYSSLSYLMQLPITTLKIDKSFIDRVPVRPGDHTLTEAIIMIGRRMGLEVVAEGVETRDQMEYLLHSDCDTIQGYLISKPLPSGEVQPFMEVYTRSRNQPQADLC